MADNIESSNPKSIAKFRNYRTSGQSIAEAESELPKPSGYGKNIASNKSLPEKKRKREDGEDTELQRKFHYTRTDHNEASCSGRRNSKPAICRPIFIKLPERLLQLSVIHVDSYRKIKGRGLEQDILFPETNIHSYIPYFNNKGLHSLPELNTEQLHPDVLHGMKSHWMNVLNIGQNESFWDYEFNKHARGQSTLGQETYFKGALKVYGKLQIMRWLKSKDITAGPGRKYDSAKVQDAIEENLRHRIHLTVCADGRKRQRINHFCIFCNEFAEIRNAPQNCKQKNIQIFFEDDNNVMTEEG